MTVGKLRALEQRLSQYSKVTFGDALSILRTANDRFGVSRSEAAFVEQFLQQNADRIEPEAKKLLTSFLTEQGCAPVCTEWAGETINLECGNNPATLDDDRVIFGADGDLHGDSGVVPYTRAYGAIKDGPLRFRHGSPPPASSVLSHDEKAVLREQSPGAALDKAAATFGVKVGGFERMAGCPDFYNPKADYWWGKCHAWAWSALDATISKLVDVEGPWNERGIWLGGQWLSRADLGNWMMGVADTISLGDPNLIFDGKVSAEDLIRGTLEFLMNNGGGFIADIWNDERRGTAEKWNQPFCSSTVSTTTLEPDAARGLLKVADEKHAVGAKLVQIKARFGAEEGDDFEGESNQGAKQWNMYVVLDSKGEMLKAYMADDKALKKVDGLPYTESDELPDYFWKPKLEALEDTLAGRSNPIVERDQFGPEFKFFVEYALKKGVPGVTRKEFEKACAALPAEPGPRAERLAQLREQFPGVANAYAPEQWQRAFADLDPKSFGAEWSA